MYSPIKITETTHYIGVNDRRKPLFENQIPLPYGVSYNSYIVEDERTALIDTVDVCYFDVFLRKIDAVLGNRPLDYLIINHMEPDHSGSIRLIRERYPDIQIVGNAKTFDMIRGYFGITDNLLEVKDGDTLSLGRQTLQFILTPMVHWPETMMTYNPFDGTLFSGDAFGSFGTPDGGILDSSINTDRFWSEMRRYYANIVGKYGVPVQSALNKLKSVKINTICSTHGAVWVEQKEKVIDLYDKLSRYEPLEQGAVIAYGSMYGHTEEMAEAIAEGISAGGVKNVVLYDVSKTDSSFILSDIFKYSAVVIGSPTYMNEIMPAVETLLHKIEIRGIKNRIFAAFGSCTWAGVAPKRILPVAENLKWNIIGAVEEKQALKAEKYAEFFELGQNIAKQIS
ncbi:MAG: FprA family A-type flavoprotein [Prevotellaceae bacterium]|jgi:flavorubredoxin|nr:FprA family A-type flavoprotein [Prevotellaceae bacterium]